jgi:hypothetical protein
MAKLLSTLSLKKEKHLEYFLSTMRFECDLVTLPGMRITLETGATTGAEKVLLRVVEAYKGSEYTKFWFWSMICAPGFS